MTGFQMLFLLLQTCYEVAFRIIIFVMIWLHSCHVVYSGLNVKYDFISISCNVTTFFYIKYLVIAVIWLLKKEYLYWALCLPLHRWPRETRTPPWCSWKRSFERTRLCGGSTTLRLSRLPWREVCASPLTSGPLCFMGINRTSPTCSPSSTRFSIISNPVLLATWLLLCVNKRLCII